MVTAVAEYEYFSPGAIGLPTAVDLHSLRAWCLPCLPLQQPWKQRIGWWHIESHVEKAFSSLTIEIECKFTFFKSLYHFIDCPASHFAHRDAHTNSTYNSNILSL